MIAVFKSLLFIFLITFIQFRWSFHDVFETDKLTVNFYWNTDGFQKVEDK